MKEGTVRRQPAEIREVKVGFLVGNLAPWTFAVEPFPGSSVLGLQLCTVSL